jgi:hypothetical protein
MEKIVYDPQDSNLSVMLLAFTYVSAILKYSPNFTKVIVSPTWKCCDREYPLTEPIRSQSGTLCRTLKFLDGILLALICVSTRQQYMTFLPKVNDFPT